MDSLPWKTGQSPSAWRRPVLTPVRMSISRRLQKKMASYSPRKKGIEFHYGTHVRRVHKSPTKRWLIETEQHGRKNQFKADVLFVAAGGGRFPAKSQSLATTVWFAGFPGGWAFLLAEIDEEAARSYPAKTYGKAKVGAPAYVCSPS